MSYLERTAKKLLPILEQIKKGKVETLEINEELSSSNQEDVDLEEEEEEDSLFTQNLEDQPKD